MLCLNKHEQKTFTRRHFKFLNTITTMKGFQEEVAANWNRPMHGNAMIVLWKKLYRLQPTIRSLSKTINKSHSQLEKAKTDLKEDQHALSHDKMNNHKIERAKRCTKKVLNWSNIEDKYSSKEPSLIG